MLKYLLIAVFVVSGTFVWLPADFYEVILNLTRQMGNGVLDGPVLAIVLSIILCTLIYVNIMSAISSPKWTEDQEFFKILNFVGYSLLYLLLILHISAHLSNTSNTLRYTSIEWTGGVIVVLIYVAQIGCALYVSGSTAMLPRAVGSSGVFMVLAIGAGLLPSADWLPKLYWLASVVNFVILYGWLRYHPLTEDMDSLGEGLMSLISTPIFAIVLVLCIYISGPVKTVMSPISSTYTYVAQVSKNSAKVQIGKDFKTIYINEAFLPQMTVGRRYVGYAYSQNEYYLMYLLGEFVLGALVVIGISLMIYM